MSSLHVQSINALALLNAELRFLIATNAPTYLDRAKTGITDELAELGVPKEDIVLAYHPPYKRPYTGFGPDNQH